MKNIIAEVTVTEDGQDTSYSTLCPSGERTHQFLYWLMRDLIHLQRDSLIRIPNTDLTIDRRNVTAVALTLSF